MVVDRCRGLSLCFGIAEVGAQNSRIPIRSLGKEEIHTNNAVITEPIGACVQWYWRQVEELGLVVPGTSVFQ